MTEPERETIHCKLTGIDLMGGLVAIWTEIRQRGRLQGKQEVLIIE